MSGCLIVGAAPAVDRAGFYRASIREAEWLIAADAAGEWCVQMGRVPDLTVGDFDSATAGARERLQAAGSAVVSLPTAKDESDLDACAAAARARGVDWVTFTAAFEGRVDHTLAALGTVMRCADIGASVSEPTWWAQVVAQADGPQTLPIPAGGLFTVVSAAGASGLSIEGARFPLRGSELEPLSALGLSNVAVSDGVTLRVGRGMVLVIVQR